mgnify:CR=1 FL=1
MKKILYYAALLFAGTFLTTSCVGDLNQYPHIETTSADVYTSAANYKAVLGKLYVSFVISGQEKGGGNSDMSSNSGYDYLRCYFNMQECGTDELVYTWQEGDKMSGLTYLSWDANDVWVSDTYYRIYYTIALCNEFLRNATDGQISAFSESEQEEIRHYRAEARFIRALAYTHALDLFRNVPFVTEEDPVGNYLPPRYTGKQLFDYLESELKAIDNDLLDRTACEYGRASRSAAHALLARLYLNAEVYTGTAQWQNAMDYAEKVINNGYYHLCTEGATNPVTGEVYSAYQMLFLADNNTNGAQYENIFPILFDGVTTKSYGGMNFLVLATYNSTMDVTIPSGTNCSWGKCARVRKQLLDKFYTATPPSGKTVAEMTAPANDDRALFYGDGFSASIKDETDATAGFACVKFRNVRSDGQSNQVVDYVNADLPFFRVAEAYLIYAEASTRLNGSNTDAKEKINELRSRANAAQKNLYTLDDICDEWAREFWFEGRRRMDLIRFNKYAGQASYKWEWMGGTYEGAQFSNIRAIFALPENDLANNSNLIQNPGY